MARYKFYIVLYKLYYIARQTTDRRTTTNSERVHVR